jgi:excisionase family DNA binding protein
MAAVKARHPAAEETHAASSGSRPAGESGSHPAVTPQSGARRRGREAIKFFTIDEVAESLNVSTRTVRRWIDSGELVTHHFGAAVRISEADLRAFLALNRDG